jgi:hypothetical protein
MASIMKDAQHWRDRAAEMRRLATQIEDPAARRTVVEIAERYDELAKRADLRA